jgi:hypothetical protein
MIRLRTVGTLFLLAIVLSGCPKPQIASNILDPTDFARNLFKIARAGDVDAWGEQLSNARRSQGNAYIKKHFDSWAPILLQLETSFGVPIEDVEFRKQDNALEFQFDRKWKLLFRVVNEDGGLKINQD